MQKMIFLLSILVITIGSSCNSSSEGIEREIKLEKHDSTHKERTEVDTIGMKMRDNELKSK